MSPDATRALACAVLAGLLAGAPGAAEPTQCDDAALRPSLLSEGDDLVAAGRPQEALASYRRAREAAAAAGDAPGVARAQAGAVRALAAVAPSAEFGARLTEASASAAGLADALEAATLLLHLGRSAEIAARASEPVASALLARANALFEAAAQLAGDAGALRLTSFALGYRAELYERAGRGAEAEALARQALFLAAEALATDASYRWQWLLARLRAGAGDESGAIDAYRQAVASLGSLGSGWSADLDPDRALHFRREVSPVYLGLVDHLLRRSERLEDDAGRQQLLGEALAALEGLKAAELRDLFDDPCLAVQRVITPTEIAGALVVYPVLLDDRVELIASFGGRLTQLRSASDGPAVAAAARELRELLVQRTTRRYEPVASQLYDWLIRPLGPLLEADPEALVLVLTAGLRSIPPAALFDGERRQFLVEQLPVAVVPGLTLIEPRPIDRASAQLLAAGISEARQGFAALDHVPRELAAAASLFSSQSLVNREFSEPGFVRALAHTPFEIVHIASHGEFGSDPRDSFVLSWEGRIPMTRLADAIAQTRYRDEHPLELLVLSACQTATGDERAALGLAGVAVRAGARSAVATLWSVSDSAAADLMTEFYRSLREPGVSRARALQSAQLALLREGAHRHPFYWSPFVLINSWL